MKCPKCNRKIEDNKINHALHLRLAGTFDAEVEGEEKNGKMRLIPADTLDTEIEDTEIHHQSVSCPYCGYKRIMF